MTDKISVAELRAKLLDPRVEEAEVAQYFLVEPGPKGPFDTQLAVDPERVDLEDAALDGARAAGILSLANGVARLRRRWRFDARRSDPDYRGPIIVSEGDSWFEYPLKLKDTIDWLSEDYAILSLDAAGDTMKNMLARGEYVGATDEVDASILLFSAGGNDLLAGGDIVRHLAPPAPGLVARDILLPSFDELVATVLGGYQRIFATLEERKPDLRIVVHGYDLPIPTHLGHWLGGPMGQFGIADATLQRAIAQEMMDRFNQGLAALAERYPSVSYLDLRGVVTDARWYDELHPTDDGFRDVADRFRTAILQSAGAQPRGAAVDVDAAVVDTAGTPAEVLANSLPRATITHRRGHSLHVGINVASAAHYGPDLKPLAAAEFDAIDMKALADGLGYASTILLGQAATIAAVNAAYQQLATDAVPGDIVVITYSGHGGQLPDGSGDETDDFADETWCLYDDQLVDDEIYEHLAAFKAGVRVLMISDSCHSGSVFRSVAGAMVEIDPDADAPPAEIPRILPRRNAAIAYREHQDAYEARQQALAARGWKTRGFENILPIAASVRLLSGCQDWQYSYDGVANGHFTERLKRIWDRGRFTGNYEQFHRAIGAQMRADQTPGHSCIGIPDPLFDKQRPFEI